jgi:hypothetical protein
MLQHGHPFNLEPLPFEFPQRTEHGMMLGGHRNNFSAFLPWMQADAENRQIIALGRPTCNNDIIRGRSEKMADRCDRQFDLLLCISAGLMRRTPWIGIVLSHPWQHGVEDQWIHRRGGMMIEINAFQDSQPNCGKFKVKPFATPYQK